MVLLLNITYKNTSSIVIINCDAKASSDEIHRDVKNHFKIAGKIKFSYQNQEISNEILQDYVAQYYCTPGWGLMVEEISEDIIINQNVEFEIEELLLESNDIFIESVEFNKPHTSIENILTEENNDAKVSSIIDLKILNGIEDLDFKIIIKNSSTKYLENSDRIKISKIVIKYVLQKDLNIELNRYDFLYLAELVNKILPSEPGELYYSPAKHGQKASGKLYDAYNNYRKKLSESGLLQRRSYSLKHVNSAACEGFSVDSNDFTFIKSNSTQNAEFSIKWANCLQERQNLLKIDSTTTYDFINLFPVFNNNDHFIFNLLKTDVTSIFPSFSGIKTWDIFYQKVFQKLRSINDKAAQKFFKSSEHLNEESKKAVAFLLLPYLFPSTVLRTKSQNSTKLSKIEVQEKFISHFDTLEQADINERNSIELQPRIVFIGEFNNLKAYVTLCDKLYTFENPLDAVESCFCIYMGLNVEYSKETKIIWNFIQKYVFKICTQHDLNNTSIRSVYYKLIH